MSEIVMYDDPDAATFVTNISGWVSKKGHFYGNNESSEDMARYDGCTHRPCQDCGKPAPKHWLICDECRLEKDKEKYFAMPGLTYEQYIAANRYAPNICLYSDSMDEYFYDFDYVDDYCYEHDMDHYDLRLIWCEPTLLPLVNPYELYQDVLCDDQDLPSEIESAFNTLNDIIVEYNMHNITSWSPGKYRVIS